MLAQEKSLFEDDAGATSAEARTETSARPAYRTHTSSDRGDEFSFNLEGQGRALSYNAEAKKEKESIWDRVTSYRRYLSKEWPLVRWNRFWEIPKIPIYNLLSNAISSALLDPERKKTGLILDTVYSWLEEQASNLSNEAQKLMLAIMPALKANYEYATGATKIKRVWTFFFNGQDFPIYISSGDATPTDEELKKRIEDLKKSQDNGEGGKCYRSPFDKMVNSESEPLLDDGFKSVLDKYTRQWHSRYFHDKSDNMYRWIVKGDITFIYSDGVRDKAEEAKAKTSGLKVFKRPVDEGGLWRYYGKLIGDKRPASGKSWRYWLLGDKLVDAASLFGGELALVGAESIKAPKDLLRSIAEKYMKISDRARRRFLDISGLAFEMPA